MKYQQHPPYCIDIELTEGCNLRCSFCGIQAIRDAPGQFKFMTLKTATALAKGIAAEGWTSRLECSGHGEPSLNPNRVEVVRTLRQHNPKNQIAFTSNGAGFMKDPAEEVKALFDAGLNVLILDDYDHVTIVDKLFQRGLESTGVQVVKYPNDGLQWNPYRRRKPGTQLIVVLPDLGTTMEGVHSHANNRAGQAAPPSSKAEGKRCVKPFRDLVVRWDGNVNSCCNDYRGVIKIGNVNATPANELWQNKTFNSLRRYLYHGKRDFVPCKGCDFVGFRPGLLPDHMGKETLPKPTASDKEVMHQATTGRTYTPIVLRQWEPGRGKRSDD